MLRNGRAATSAISIALLVVQAACLGPMGPQVPLRPENPTQMCAIRNADRILVWTVDNQQYKLNNASVVEQGLTGEWLVPASVPHPRGPWRPGPAVGGPHREGGEEVVPIPVDSVAGIQLHKVHGRGFGLFMLGVLTGAGGLLGVIAATWP